MTKRGKWLIAVGIVALTGSSRGACAAMRGGETKQVEIETVEKRVISPTILASGNLTYQTEIRMVSEVMGRVKELQGQGRRPGKEGRRAAAPGPGHRRSAGLAAGSGRAAVAAGHPANQGAAGNPRDQAGSLREVAHRRAWSTQNTYDDLKSQRDLSRVELDSSEQQLLQTQAQLSQMREQLAKTVLRAPIDGRVTQLTIKIGETAVPSVTSIAGSDLMVVSDTSNLYAEVNVNETDVARINVGQEARIAPAAFPDDIWPGTVETVAVSPRQVAGQGKTYPVKIRLQPGENPKFHTGMSCRAEIVTRLGAATAQVAVPVQAIRYEETTDAAQGCQGQRIHREGRSRRRRRPSRPALRTTPGSPSRRAWKKKQDIVVGPARELRFLQERRSRRAPGRRQGQARCHQAGEGSKVRGRAGK